jgi:hypothetical protein
MLIHHLINYVNGTLTMVVRSVTKISNFKSDRKTTSAVERRRMAMANGERKARLCGTDFETHVEYGMDRLILTYFL